MSINSLKQGLKARLLLISLAVMLLSLALPIAMLQVYDRILPNQGVGTAWVLALGVLSAMLLEALLRYGRSWLLNRAGMKFEAWSNVEAMKRLLAASPGELHALGPAHIEEGFTALRRLQEYYSGQAMLALYDAPFIFLFLGMIAYVGGAVVVIPVAVLIVAFITVFVLGSKARYYAEHYEMASARRAGMLSGMFSRMLSLKGMALEGPMIASFDESHRQTASYRAGLDEYLMRIQLVTAFFSQATTVLVVMLSAHLVISGEMSSGALAACTLLAGRTMAPVGALFSFWGRYQSTGNAQAKAEALLSLGQEGSQSPNPESQEPVGLECPSLQLEGMTVPVSLSIPAGTVVRLAESGWMSWTPLFESLTDISADEKGLCKITNQNIGREDIRVVYVDETAAVFQGSVIENLTTFTASREQLALEWAEKLGLHERLIQLPHGYQTQLAERYGSGIDRGTRQLIGIARAIVCQPNLLLLDHADHGLDITSQKRLASVLSGLEGQLTCIVVTGSPAIAEVIPLAVTAPVSNVGGARA